MIPARVIEAKRDGERLEPSLLRAFLEAYLRGEVPDYQMAAFLMAAYLRGLDDDETDTFVRCMIESGSTLDVSHLPGPRIDKHSTGGVGDKVSLALAPLAAALGLYVPMISGRGLGHTGGTLDKLEAIPGFRTDLSLSRFKQVLEGVGCAIIGQTTEIAPLDRRLYALRDVTGTVSAIPLIAASIMSKKLAEDLDGLLLDVKLGSGAFVREEGRATELAEKMVMIGASHGVRTTALLTAMDRPLGRAVGVGLETAEAICCLGDEGPEDLRALVLAEAGEMVRLGDAGTSADEAMERAEAALVSGAGRERFARLVEAQGGDTGVLDRPERLRTAPEVRTMEALEAGVVVEVRPRTLGEGVIALGGGRVIMHQPVDPGVGFELEVVPGDPVEKGQPLGRVYARDPTGVEVGLAALRRSVRLGPPGDTVAPLPLVTGRITGPDLTPP